jgi:hypothetical protein
MGFARAGIGRRLKASKRRLSADNQPAEETPRQARVIGKDDAVRLGNHGAYIANGSDFDNEDEFLALLNCSVPLRWPRAARSSKGDGLGLPSFEARLRRTPQDDASLLVPASTHKKGPRERPP